MSRSFATLLAVLAAGLFVLALVFLSRENLRPAAVAFLATSVVIYLRETRASA